MARPAASPSRLLLLLLLLPSLVSAKSKYMSDIPNGFHVPNWPAVGHSRPAEGSSLNGFGRDFKREGKEWTRALCMMDSDGDGYSNGVELDDPHCSWRKGDPDPPPTGRGITHPGVPDRPDGPSPEATSAPSTAPVMAPDSTSSPSFSTFRPTTPSAIRNSPSLVLVIHVLVGALTAAGLVPLVGLVRAALPKSVFVTKLHKYVGYLTLMGMVSAAGLGLAPRLSDWGREWSAHGLLSLVLAGQLSLAAFRNVSGPTHAILARWLAPWTTVVVVVSGVWRAKELEQEYLFALALGGALLASGLALLGLLGLRWWKKPAEARPDLEAGLLEGESEDSSSTVG